MLLCAPLVFASFAFCVLRERASGLQAMAWRVFCACSRPLVSACSWALEMKEAAGPSCGFKMRYGCVARIACSAGPDAGTPCAWCRSRNTSGCASCEDSACCRPGRFPPVAVIRSPRRPSQPLRQRARTGVLRPMRAWHRRSGAGFLLVRSGCIPRGAELRRIPDAR